MEQLNCCNEPGFCPTYNRELWGLIWARAHGIKCSQVEHERMKEMLLRTKPQEGLEASKLPLESIRAAVQGQGNVWKPCNCGKGKRKSV